MENLFVLGYSFIVVGVVGMACLLAYSFILNNEDLKDKIIGDLE